MVSVSFWSAVAHEFRASEKAKAARGFLGPYQDASRLSIEIEMSFVS